MRKSLKRKKMGEEEPLTAIGGLMVGGGDGTVAEVATSFPACCLGTIRTRKKFLEISKEEDEESLDL